MTVAAGSLRLGASMLTISMTTGCGSPPRSGIAGIIGDDDRRDFYTLDDSGVKEAARSAMVMLSQKYLTRVPGAGGMEYHLDRYKTYGDSYHLCTDEAFYDQPAVGYCSASLIGDDLALTAGHCVPSLEDCQKRSFVFDFVAEGPKSVRTTFSEEQVYFCQDVVASVKFGWQDYALVKLDRKVVGRSPLFLSLDPVRPEQKVINFAFPSGLPLKAVAGMQVDGGFVDEKVAFEADLDVFGGSSGSIVVDANSHAALGVVVVGFGEYGRVNGEACQRPKRYADKDEASLPVVTRTAAMGYLPARLRLSQQALQAVGLSFSEPELGSMTRFDAHTRAFDDSLIPAIRFLTKLEKMDVSGTALSDEGLQELQSLFRLKQLNVEGTDVTVAGVAEFLRRHPQGPVLQVVMTKK